MQPFHRQDPFKCPKCGWSMSKRQYCAGEVSTNKEGEKVYQCSQRHEGEHLHLICADCNYTQLRAVNPEASTRMR